ncbi:MAG: DUF4124 domain-containing protein [Pseudomarimonas sp.]
MSTRLLVTVLAAWMLLTSTSTVIAKELYRWKDEKGVTHYSDTKPEGAEFERRDVTNDPPKPAGAAAAAATAEGEQTEVAPASPAAPSANCLQARSNVEMLENSKEVKMDLDGDGTPEVLGVDAQLSQLNRQRELVKLLCVP